jgi:hypothetical protein
MSLHAKISMSTKAFARHGHDLHNETRKQIQATHANIKLKLIYLSISMSSTKGIKSWSRLDLNNFYLDPFENFKLILSSLSKCCSGPYQMCLSLMVHLILVLAPHLM